MATQLKVISPRARAADIDDLRARYEDIYSQALTFMHKRRGAGYTAALASAMILAAVTYLGQFDRSTLKAFRTYIDNVIGDDGSAA